MNAPGHLMILASAGSGKTYALTTRFVRLLAGGAEPDRVVALTFTRKAAGEFFDEILNRLAGAAVDPSAAAALATEIDRPELTAADFCRLLRAMIEAMPRLNLGTLDGFFARMVQAFPLELGLGGEFELLEASQAQRERRRVLALMFHAGAATAEARQDFIEAFKRATYGVEEKALQRRLDVFLDEHGETYRAASARSVWGNAAAIWPQGNGWLEEAPPMESAVAAARQALPWGDLNDKQRGVLEGFLGAITEWEAGSPLPGEAVTPVKNILANREALPVGKATMPVGGKRHEFAAAAGQALVGVVTAIMAAEFNRKLEVTRGIHAVVRLYEEKYDKEVRRAGRLTFADVQRLLQPLADDALANARRMLMEWRLDARFDHWLLDEFQDTSREQWQILHSLIDEAVQDPEGSRSFFYVGDVKQAIYGWRGGDSRLFREIAEHYNQGAAPVIREQHLAKSWRSAAPVIALVNAVGSDESALAEVVPAGVVDRWKREWQDHESARSELTGFAALHLAEDEASRWAETLRILQEIDAAERGLTVAVLVQKNQTGADLAEYLRAEGGMAAVAESDLHIAFDNPFTCALLALLRWAAHPGDRFAAEAVAMTPVAAKLAELGWSGAARIAAEVLGELHVQGFSGWLATWAKRMSSELAADDSFSRLRGTQLVDAARQFDETGSRDVDEFLTWIEMHTLREVEAPGVVRVMTVHKAKGLGFDVVVLPDLQGQSVARRRSGLAVHRDENQTVDWVLDLPSKAMAEADPVLKDQIDQDTADAGYEALCKLYVALTRAKRALHVVIEPVGRSRSRNFPLLLSSALGEEWSQGDPRWFESIVAETAAGTHQSGESPALDPARRINRRVALTPSGGEAMQLAASRFFDVGGADASKRGREIHRLLARVEWLDDLDSTDIRGVLAAGAEEDLELVEMIAGAVNAPEIRSIFTRGESGTKALWRERPFEVVLEGNWITGVFDRVMVETDAHGKPARATVVDFKSDRVQGEDDLDRAVKRHQAQIEIYQKVVALMTGLPVQHIEAQLVFTELRRVISVE